MGTRAQVPAVVLLMMVYSAVLYQLIAPCAAPAARKWLQHLLLPFPGLLIVLVLYGRGPAARKPGAAWVLIGDDDYDALTLRARTFLSAASRRDR
jgi:hypothetical protein